MKSLNADTAQLPAEIRVVIEPWDGVAIFGEDAGQLVDDRVPVVAERVNTVLNGSCPEFDPAVTVEGVPGAIPRWLWRSRRLPNRRR